MAIELAKAYVQIVPTTDGIKNNITNELGGDLEEAGSKGGASWGNAFSSFATAALSAVGTTITAAGAAVVGITKQAVESYADYEQLVGGVETLFGEEQSKAVIENARRAYETAGLSANAYMETVTGFSASLMQSLGGDTKKAVDYADRALRDMSDNANKMGTSMESIQNAYSGFAKGNMTMLDNLKLGYGGTKEEALRLVEDASKMTDVMEELGITVDANDLSFGNLVNAISVVQQNLGITGTTAIEASETISGSLASMQSAWQNVLTSMAADNGTFEQAVDDFVTTIVGKKEGEGVIANIIPRIEKTLLGVGDLVTKLAPIIADKVPPMIENILPTLITAVQSLINAVAKALPTLIRAIINVMPNVMTLIVNTLIELIPMLLDCALELVEALTDGLEEALPVLVPPTMDMILLVVDTIINNLDLILNCAFRIIGALADGLVEYTPTLLEHGAKLIVDFAKSIEDTLWTVVTQGTYLIERLIDGIEQKMPELKAVAAGLPAKISEELKRETYKIQEQGTTWAVHLLTGMEDGITKLLGEGNWVSNIINKIINALKSAFTATWSSVDWFSDVSLPTIPLSVNQTVTSTSTTNYVPNSAPSTVDIKVKVEPDPKKTVKANISTSYKQSKASGIPSHLQ